MLPLQIGANFIPLFRLFVHSLKHLIQLVLALLQLSVNVWPQFIPVSSPLPFDRKTLFAMCRRVTRAKSLRFANAGASGQPSWIL